VIFSSQGKQAMNEADAAIHTPSSPKEHTVLCVDDEKNILHSLRRLLRQERYRLVTASSGLEALSLLERVVAHVVISDQRMPEMSGVEFLSRVKDRHPDVIRIILSGYTDVDSITEAINKGHIFKFLLKPWNDENLKIEIRQALQQYDLIQDNRRLHERVLHQNEQLLKINETLEVIVAERTRELELKNQALELSHAILEDVPCPVLGVSSDGMVAFVNRQVQALRAFGLAIDVGDNAFEVFPPEVNEQLRTGFAGVETGRKSVCVQPGSCFDIDVQPLSGRFRGKGAVMILTFPQPDADG
jgi:response regulator RpfG family c-di-GMP phosphodiesterase